MSERRIGVGVLSNRSVDCRGGSVKYRYRFGERPLDGYTIRRGIGQGGFGEVYFAVSDGGREVALKSILRNEEIELRGVRECINLKSPQLVSVFDVRQADDGTAFVIMEYMTGPSLRDLLRRHPQGLGEAETVHLIKEVGKGLTCLHDHGIVHRDLKPENIFYEDGHAKIGDYGLAKMLSASRQSGQTMSVGTVHYMAPEIGSGNYQRGGRHLLAGDHPPRAADRRGALRRGQLRRDPHEAPHGRARSLGAQRADALDRLGVAPQGSARAVPVG